MKPSGAPARPNSWKDKKKTEETAMKFRTKIAIFALAAILSLAGFGVLVDALSVDRIMAAAQPETVVGVVITG
jgi:hypothetical protein